MDMSNKLLEVYWDSVPTVLWAHCLQHDSRLSSEKCIWQNSTPVFWLFEEAAVDTRPWTCEKKGMCNQNHTSCSIMCIKLPTTIQKNRIQSHTSLSVCTSITRSYHSKFHLHSVSNKALRCLTPSSPFAIQGTTLATCDWMAPYAW